MSLEVKPTIGRIVLFTLPPDYWQYLSDGDRVRPAIVTRVWEEPNLINCRVIPDPNGRWHWPQRS